MPAVALTPYATEADCERALEAGFHTHVSKPVEPPALISAVVAVLGRDANSPGASHNRVAVVQPPL